VKQLKKATMATMALSTASMLFASAAPVAQAKARSANNTIVLAQHLPYERQFIPYVSNLLYTSNIVNLAFDSLMNLDTKLKWIPWLAKSYSWSADKKTVTMKLDPKAVWSDGQPITSDDVLFTLNALGSPDYVNALQGENQYIVDPIKGADLVESGKAKSFADVGGFKKIDNKTFSITFKQVDAAVLWSSIAGLQPMPYHILKNVPIKTWATAAFNQKPTVSSGPYIFSKVNGTDSVEMVANPKYFKGKPKIQNLVYRTVASDVMPGLLAKGDVDYIGDGLAPKDIPNLQQIPNIDVYTTPSFSYHYIGFKLYKKEFQDFRVREAFAYALDRKAIVKGILKGYGQVLNGPLPTVSWAAATPKDGLKTYDYNPKLANKLLDQAGWVKRGDWRIDPYTGKTAELHIVTPGDQIRNADAVAFQQALAAVGVKVVIDPPLNVTTMYKRVQNDDPSIQMWIGGWSLAVDPDPRGLWGSNDSNNYPRWKDKTNDKLIAATYDAKAFDVNQRKKALVAWQLYVNKNLPMIFLYQQVNVYAINKNVHIPKNDYGATGPINIFEWTVS
jgi:peptide/nickel transport system substrate-binding protein